MCKVFTSTIRCRDKDKLDITVKGGISVLAPTWQMVMGHKLRTGYVPLTDAEYTSQYLQLLRTRWERNPEFFLNILKRDRVVLCCYCAPGKFCHRHIAVNVLRKIAERHNMPFEYGGEI